VLKNEGGDIVFWQGVLQDAESRNKHKAGGKEVQREV